MEVAAAEEKAWKEKEERINWTLLAQEIGQQGETLQNVIKDLRSRETLGLQKYGKALTSRTEDDMLQHLYEELLDGAMYIRTLIEQRKKNG